MTTSTKPSDTSPTPVSIASTDPTTSKYPELRIWTQAYRPFLMGGDVHGPVATMVPVQGPYDLGRGYQGYLTISPRGTTYVVEAVGGGIVGNSIEAVRRDIQEGDVKLMVQQVRESTKQCARAELLPSKEFWALMRQL